ncbi:hypothetical protein Q5P01_017876 [Channa striata]|uniref:Uncharacterized protein n=1 Tax=Channa striata TaxID=64152 RepID=A0AA88M3F0_CHASR|nr:hypothetical protein Q5P01_017876 [Channa striata]
MDKYVAGRKKGGRRHALHGLRGVPDATEVRVVHAGSVVIQETLESPILYIPNLYMKDVRGGDVHVDGRGGPYDMVIADAFSGFCPESDSASGYHRPYLFTTGRSQALQGLGGTYGVGLTSDKKLMTACHPTAQEPLVERLAPRISGTGVFACNPMRTTSRLIAPVFSRVFHAPSYNRILRI